MKNVKAIADYKGSVKGLRPYLLSLTYDNVIPFRQKKTASAKAATRKTRIIKLTTLSLPDTVA